MTNGKVNLSVVATKVDDLREDVKSIKAEMRMQREEILRLIEKQEAEIDRLKESDKRWAGASAIFAAIISAIGGLIVGIGK